MQKTFEVNGLPEEDAGEPACFARIVDELAAHGYCLLDQAIPAALSEALHARVTSLNHSEFATAGIGRAQDFGQNERIRSDEIHWLGQDDAAERAWLAWIEQLRVYVNRHLFLGLFSYEGHFAHYPPGAFYKRHVDAFRGESNRMLTVVLYLNPEWHADDGGEMLMYAPQGEQPFARLVPQMGRVAVFLSEEFPHEVLPAKRDRYSIAGWYRINTSSAGRIDPPD